MKRKERETPVGPRLRAIGELARRQGYEAGMVERVGGGDPFKVLVSCILSLRTKDELSEEKSRELWLRADSPAGMIALGPDGLARVIFPVGFYRRKAAQIVALSRILIAEHGGLVPDTIDGLLVLPGVGRKTANLVVTAGFGAPGICVDTHVHRIMNRWGYVATASPVETERALRGKLPRRHWLVVNSLLVFFGKTVCQPLSPKCSQCPTAVARPCPRLGVGHSR